MATTAEAKPLVHKHSGAVALGAIALLALWLWPLTLLLVAAWASELKVMTTACRRVVRRHVDGPPGLVARQSIGWAHLGLLIFGSCAAIALPGPMLMAVFVGALFSIPAVHLIRTDASARSAVHQPAVPRAGSREHSWVHVSSTPVDGRMPRTRQAA